MAWIETDRARHLPGHGHSDFPDLRLVLLLDRRFVVRACHGVVHFLREPPALPCRGHIVVLVRRECAEENQNASHMITTRVAALADIPILVELMWEFYAEANYALDATWAAETFSTVMRDDSRGMAWIMSEENRPIGYVVLTFRLSMEFGGSDAFIDDLFVRPEYRRHGAGRAALTAAFDESRRRGVLAMHVETADDNVAAKALYGGFGLEDRKRLLLTAKLTARRESPLQEIRLSS